MSRLHDIKTGRTKKRSVKPYYPEDKKKKEEIPEEEKETGYTYEFYHDICQRR